MSGDSTAPGSLGAQLTLLQNKDTTLRSSLDTADSNMIGTVSDAWTQDKNIITNTAQKAAAVLSQAEMSGPQLVTNEMRAMLSVANQNVRTNSATVSQLARAQILQANSTARTVAQQATQLLQATNTTIGRANNVFLNMNQTDQSLSQAQSSLSTQLAQLKTDVISKAQSEVLTAQNSSSDAQVKAGSQVDSALAKVVTAVTTALTRLTQDESANLTSIGASVDTDSNSFLSQIQSNINDANRNSQTLQSTYDQNMTGTMNDANQLFAQVDQSLTSSGSSLNAANATMQALRSFMTTQFNDVSNQMTALFTNQSQQAQLQQTALSSLMDSMLASFKVEALNATSDGSASLKAAYDSAIQTITSGSDSLGLSFDQRQKIVAALQNWQQNYQGNTNQLVNAFGSTYSGLVSDTNSALTGAVSQQAAQLTALTASQQQLMNDAINAAQGDPNKLNAILAQFGVVGTRATAAAQAIAQNMNTAGSAVQNGLNQGLNALSLIQQAAQATSSTYQQAAALNTQATTTAQAAVQNVTVRLGTMNAVMQQYATQLSQQLFGATSDAAQAISGAANNNSQQLSADVQAKMASVQQMLTTVLGKGQTSAADLNAFAAQVGANATALSNLVNALQSGSSDSLAAVTSAQKSAIDGLKSQVSSQLSAATSDFSSQLSSQQNSLMSLVDGLRTDLTTQAGSKSALLVQQRDLLQSLFGSMSSSSIQRQAASSDMQKKLQDAQAKAASGMAELAGLIAAQKSRVLTAFNDKSNTMKAAGQSVNGTISDTNRSAASVLNDLQSKGQSKIDGIKKSLADSSAAVDVMVGRYHAQVAQAMEDDRRSRLSMQADEMAKIASVQSAFAQSSMDQYQALQVRQAQAQARATALANMIGSLSGASAAAAQGDQAFVNYVTALAAQTNTNMGLLVQAMQANISSGNSALRDMLAKNSIFATSVMNTLNSQASALGQGAVDGGNGLLGTLAASRANSQAMAGQQAAVFNGVNAQTTQMATLTNDQLVQLMTIFLAQSSLQDSAFAQANNDTMNAIASLGDAMDISQSTMDAISDTTADALELAANETSEAQVEVDAATNAVINYASGAASNITSQAQQYYNALKQALTQSTSFMSAFRDRLADDQTTFNKATPDFDSQLSALKAAVSGLGKTLDANKQGAIDRVNQWAMSMQQNALNQLSSLQSQATR